MPRSSPWTTAAVLAVLAGTACRTAAPAPAPAAPVADPAAAPAAAPVARADDGRVPLPDGARRYTAADVRFMQGMIGHHAQALAMTALLPARTTRPDMRLLAERIDVSQKSEIAMMQRWLRERGEPVPDADAEHAHHDMAGMAGMSGGSAAGGQPSMPGMMPGMLTPEQMARLAASTGVEFERLFLESMIRHHEGALTMVGQLFGSPGAAQETEVYRFASDVDADQRAEIARMRTLLAALAAAPARR